MEERLPIGIVMIRLIMENKSIPSYTPSTYKEGFLETFSNFTSEKARRLLGTITQSLEEIEFTEELFEKEPINLISNPIKLWILSEITIYRDSKDNHIEAEFLRNLDLKLFKDFESILDPFINLVSIIEENFGSLSDEEKILVYVLFELRIGILDSYDLFFRLFTVHKFLFTEKIRFDYKSFIFLIGINNILRLQSIKNLLERGDFKLEELIEVGFYNNKDIHSARGCPFVLYQIEIVKDLIEVLEAFFEKLYTHFSYLLAGDLNVDLSCKDLRYLFAKFQYNERALLSSDKFFRKIE